MFVLANPSVPPGLDYFVDGHGRMLSVPRETYQRLLYEAAVREGVTVRFGARVEKINDLEAGPSVTLASGERIRADLIVGADGILLLLLPQRKQRFT